MLEEPLVHLIDDDAGARQSIGFLLASAQIAFRLYETADDFLVYVDPGMRGCIVSDVRLPGMDGLTLLTEVRSRGVAMPFVVITGYADVAMAVTAMKRGAADFIEKPFEEETLLSAIRSAFDAERTDRERKLRVDAVRSRLDSLTERQRQVLEGLVSGKPNKAIAQDLKLSPRTVEIHRANLMTKMGVRALSELVGMVLDPAGTASTDRQKAPRRGRT